MSKLIAEEYKSFEKIRRTKEDGTEYWSARELSKVLEYKKWENFAKVIDRAKLACRNSGQEVDDHFAKVNQDIKIGKNIVKKRLDYELSRHACYLIIQNGDSRKEPIARLQTYLAIQTLKASEGLEANLFYITQEEAKLKRENAKTKEKLMLDE